MEKTFQDDAWDDYIYWFQTNNKAVLKRIHALLKDIERDPYNGIGDPEELKHDLSGCFSRRIDRENRMVYTVEESQIIIIYCRGHYI